MQVVVVLAAIVLSVVTLLALDKDGLRRLDSEEFLEDDEYFTNHH
mgnify:CR=1 FL=1|jgi:hypothetical protein